MDVSTERSERLDNKRREARRQERRDKCGEDRPKMKRYKRRLKRDMMSREV
jgi:hypothetical protein